MRTRRERRSRQALAILGRERLLAFLRALEQPHQCFAVTLFLARMDEGETVPAILFDGQAFGYSLEAAPLSPDRFWIRFGCQPDPSVGDGGEWEVEFDATGAVVTVTSGLRWLS